MMTLIMKQEGLDDDDQDVFKEVMSYLEQALKLKKLETEN